MKQVRWNGEYWYHDNRGALRRVGTWLLWPGGWGTFRSWPLRKRLRPHYWTPFSLFGHRVTFYGWGVQWRVAGAYWVYTRRPGKRRLYRSVNGTPDRAHIWWLGAPRDVRSAADEHQAKRAALATPHTGGDAQ